MHVSSSHLTTDEHGRLCVQVPRVAYWALAAVFALAAAAMVTRWGEGVARGLEKAAAIAPG